jgi:hypothetical protein
VPGKPSTARWGLGLAIALTLLTRSVFALAAP